MEKKTIGDFIAALRKANGMTQKDLAERLHVSDKTVSRWECNDGAPDLSAIPVLAEIFGVTCDELLRGERKSPSEAVSDPQEETYTPKGEKQRQRLLAVSLSGYRSRTWISMGIAIGGLIAAMVSNMGFHRAYIGFFIGTAFYLASAVCQAIWINGAFLTVSDDSLNSMEIGRFKHAVIRRAEQAFGLIAVLLGVILPLLVFPNDAYVGLGIEACFLYGALYGAIAFLFCCVICYFLNASLLKNGVYTLSDEESEIYHHSHKLKRLCAIVFLPILLVTLLAHAAFTEIWGPWSIMKGTTFHDYESFVSYMEQDIPYRHNSTNTIANEILPPTEHSVITYYDEFGNEISEEAALRITLTDRNGNVVCEYIDRNQSVCSIRYSENDDGSLLPITVCTYDDLQHAQTIVAVRHVIFAVVYGLEIITILAVYWRKRAK